MSPPYSCHLDHGDEALALREYQELYGVWGEEAPRWLSSSTKQRFPIEKELKRRLYCHRWLSFSAIFRAAVNLLQPMEGKIKLIWHSKNQYAGAMRVKRVSLLSFLYRTHVLAGVTELQGNHSTHKSWDVITSFRTFIVALVVA